VANRRIEVLDLGELVRMLRAGVSNREIARLLGHHRDTVAEYRGWAEARGLLEGEQPGEGELRRLVAATLPAKAPPQQVSSLAAYVEEVKEYRARGMEMAAIRA